MTTTDDQDRRGDPERSDPTDPNRVLRIPGLKTGARFAGRYEIRERLGSGAVGEVYRAFDHGANQEVALKVLYPGSGIRTVERLRRELRLVRRLSHPGIVRVWDIGEHEGLSYLVSEILEGESLRERMDRSGRFAPEHAEAILREVFDALDHAHRNGVVHRDVKPSNIFLVRRAGEERERAVLLDFGLARHAEEIADLTATGRFVGTPQYCAPEQIRAEADVGPAADLYACGVTLWELLAGTPPFHGRSDLDVLKAHLEQLPPHPSREMPAVPSRLRALALQLLEKEPGDRPASAAEAARLLGRPRGAARLREGFAWLRHLLETPRHYGRPVVVAVALVALSGAAWWGLSPVDANIRDGRLVWHLRIGSDLDGPEIATANSGSVSLVRRPFHPFPSAYVATYDPLRIVLSKGMDGIGAMPAPLVKIDFPSKDVRPVVPLGEGAEWFRGCPYPHETPLYSGAGVLTSVDEGPVVSNGFVTYFEHVLDYPSKIVEFDAEWNLRGVYHNPGRPVHLYWFPVGPNHRPRVLAAAMNNLLGPRNVVFALDLPLESGSQAPPYTGSRELSEGAAWYLPLPASAKIYTGVTFRGNTGVVAPAGGALMEFDLETGVPLDPELRGGMDPAAWGERRSELWRALADAAGLAELGALGDAAELLETFATLEAGGPMLRSIPWYRAAVLRLEESADRGDAALEEALADVRRASRAERAARYELLEAEVLARLGRFDEARPILRGFWTHFPPYMYRFEWLLLNWRIGEGPPLDLVASSESRPVHDVAWQGAMRLAAALRRGRPDDALALWDGWRAEGFNIWDLHHVLLAEAALLADPPQADRSLYHLERAERSVSLGIPLPIRSLRAAARRTLETDREPDHAERTAIDRETAVWRRWVAKSPEAWFVDDWLRKIEGAPAGRGVTR